jgi:hypothetical protein
LFVNCFITRGKYVQSYDDWFKLCTKIESFYDAVLGTMGYEPGVIDEKWRCFYFTQSGVFAISKPINGEPASHGNGSKIGFSVKTSDIADAWFAAGIANDGSSFEDAPDMREGLIGKLYLAYLRDPSNNKVCAVHRVG